MAYLDENGLEHFWGKIKDHVSSAIAPKADDADVLHKTGTEAISGEKVFSSSQATPSGNASALIVVKDSDLVKGETPATNHYLSLGFIDSTGDSYVQDTASRLGVVEYKSPSEADPEGFMQLYDMGFNGGGGAILRVGHDKNNIQYATAPATSDERTNSTDIVTRGYMEASEWNWQKTKKAGAVTFKPVPESDLEPAVDFMFMETPPASGDKSPSNPSTIAGVSSVNVTRCGKNLIPSYPDMDEHSNNGVTYKYNGDGSFTVDGTASGGNSTFYIRSLNAGGIKLHAGETYSLSGSLSSTVRLCTRVENTDKYDLGSGLTFTATSDSIVNCFIMVTNGTTVNNLTIKPQYELSSTATAFEPYEGNDYTIQLDGTYYGGSLDVATGVMTVTHYVFEMDGTEWWTSDNDDGVSLEAYNSETGIGYSYCIPRNSMGGLQPVPFNSVCTHFPVVPNNFSLASVRDGTQATPGFCLVGDGKQFRVAFPFSTLTAWKQWLADQKTAGTPVRATVKLDTPYTVQLTPTQIRSLPVLDKYEPRINTVYTDQEAVQVGYQRFFDENRLAAIEARLDALEGN